MAEPWIEYPELWPTKSSFFVFLRGCLRRGIWEKYPPKLMFKDASAYKPPEGYQGKAKRLGKCALTGEEVAISKLEVDHLEGHVKFTDWSDIENFIKHLCASRDNMQLVTKEAHKIKSYSERMGISFEEAWIEKQAIQICKGDSKQWLIDKGVEPKSNAKLRRQQVVEVLKNEQSNKPANTT